MVTVKEILEELDLKEMKLNRALLDLQKNLEDVKQQRRDVLDKLSEEIEEEDS
jgi:prefoldin subunit 5